MVKFQNNLLLYDLIFKKILNNFIKQYNFIFITRLNLVLNVVKTWELMPIFKTILAFRIFKIIYKN